MAFCKGAMATIKHFWSQVTPELEVILEKVTQYTKIVKDLEQSPTIEMIIHAIPGGSEAERILNAALDEINGVTDVVHSFADKLTDWLASYATSTELEGGLLKLASVAVAIEDPNTGDKTNIFYDVVTLAQIADDKVNAA